MSGAGTAEKTKDAAKASDTAAGSTTKPTMPGASDFDLASEAVKQASKTGDAADNKNMTSDERERNAVFANLVKGDEDIVGLVAYSIYKQNKHDWLVAFNKAKGHEPDEAETFSYITGEGTTRRLAIYRHLAQATLEGRGPQIGGTPSKGKFVPQNLAGASSDGQSGSNKGLVWIIGVIAVVVALFIGAKFGMPGV